ncbi:Sec-independent protein translocase protein TatA [Streptomyces californicus]
MAGPARGVRCRGRPRQGGTGRKLEYARALPRVYPCGLRSLASATIGRTPGRTGSEPAPQPSRLSEKEVAHDRQLKPLEIVLIIAVILLLFGAKKLPDMARSLGKSARILKSEAKAMKKDDAATAAPTTETVDDTVPPQAATARTIQAAPGDVTSSRPVNEPKPTTQS